MEEPQLLISLFVLLIQTAAKLGGEGRRRLSLSWQRTRKYYRYCLHCTQQGGERSAAKPYQLSRSLDGARRQVRLERRLDLCRETIRCHGGRLWLGDREDLEVVCDLPAGQPPRRRFTGAILGCAPKIG